MSSVNLRQLDENGSVLVQAIIATVVIGIAALTIMQRSVDINRQLRLPRIKAAQANVELALRHLLLQPTIYTGCSSTAGTISCSLDTTSAASPINGTNGLFEAVPGCVGSPPASCGVSVQMVQSSVSHPYTPFDAEQRRFEGVIKYNGTEVQVASPRVIIVVPKEVMQSASVTCTTAAAPIFSGFNSDGSIACRPFPLGTGSNLSAPNTGCGPGQFVSAVDPTNLRVTCTTIPSAPVGCPANQYITGMNWTTGGTLTVTCAARPAPSTLWGAPPY